MPGAGSPTLLPCSQGGLAGVLPIAGGLGGVGEVGFGKEPGVFSPGGQLRPVPHHAGEEVVTLGWGWAGAQSWAASPLRALCKWEGDRGGKTRGTSVS